MVAVTLENQPIASSWVLTKDSDHHEEAAYFSSKKEFVKKMVKKVSKQYNQEFRHDRDRPKVQSYMNKDRNIELVIFFEEANLSGFLNKD